LSGNNFIWTKRGSHYPEVTTKEVAPGYYHCAPCVGKKPLSEDQIYCSTREAPLQTFKKKPCKRKSHTPNFSFNKGSLTKIKLEIPTWVRNFETNVFPRKAKFITPLEKLKEVSPLWVKKFLIPTPNCGKMSLKGINYRVKNHLRGFLKRNQTPFGVPPG